MAEHDHRADTVASLIRRLWKEGGFLIDPVHGLGREEDGICHEVAMPDDERALLDQVLQIDGEA